ncbi:MAG TPA: hypothetical protein VGK19_08170 [Capsulimonadaceae bacterium]|jgi:hypothetical protein
MRQLSGDNQLARNDQLPPPTGLGRRYGYSSHDREIGIWTALFLTSSIFTLTLIPIVIYLASSNLEDFATLAGAIAVISGTISLFMLTRPPWTLVLNGGSRSYSLRTGFKPFVKRRTGPLSDIRGIGAATVQRRGEEACVLFLVFHSTSRPFYLAWHPLPSAQVVAAEAANIGKQLDIPVITSKQVLKG